jgi:farnesyl-diphosphate farnesyltransferase
LFGLSGKYFRKKQGAYGKVQVHTESKLAQLCHLDEVFAAITFLYIKPLESNLNTEFIRTTFNEEDLAFCDEILVKVSRSFAAVIRQLPSTMLVDIMVFYLVLRALDTIEDDTSAFASHGIKIENLKTFREKALGNPEWSMDGVGEGDEKRLLQQFPKCHRIYAALNPKSREIIDDITQRMADGMAEFVGKDLGQGTKDISEYNRYCHFVAGLVGEGLSRLFSQSGLEKESFGKEVHLSDQMGLFLQKTNIIRDYLEDYVDGRAFWPQSVWKKYSKSGDLGYFAKQSDADARVKSLECLNELVTDALELVPDCLTYMSKLQCSEIFRFCAIPQVMAIATLDKCYANPDVFTGVVKIRKGTSCKLILRTNSLDEVHETFHIFAKSIIAKAKKQKAAGVDDPSHHRTMKACDTILEWTEAAYSRQSRARSVPLIISCGLLAVPGLIAFSSSSSAMTSEMKSTLYAASIGAAGLVYMFGFTMLRSQSTLKPAVDLKKKVA